MSVSGGSIEPSFQFVAVTTSDTAKLSYTNSGGVVERNRRCKAIFIGVAGNLAIKDDAGNAVVFTGVTAGSVYPISTDTIMSTNTTATDICALF